MPVPLVPDSTNFLQLLKANLGSKALFEYKRVPWGRSFFIHAETVAAMIKVLEWLDDGYRDDFLDLVPLRMTELTMKCWEIKSQPWKYRYMLRYREPEEEKHDQYIFEFDKSDLNRWECHG